MTPYYDSGGVQIHVGHVLDVLAGLEAESVQCVVTSPPYYGLRSYSTEPVIWGGDPSCPHSLEAAPAGKVLTGGTGTASAKQVSNAGSQYGNNWMSDPPGDENPGEMPPLPPPSVGSQYGNAWVEESRTIEVGATRTPSASMPHPGTQYRPVVLPVTSATCTRCKAWRGELGSEPTPDCGAWARGVEPCSVCFVCHLVVVFRAVRRVLHPTGTCWVNLGDSYSGSGCGGGSPVDVRQYGSGGPTPAGRATDHQRRGEMGRRLPPGLGPKQLLMMPARVALALQADGWVLRSDIIWSKPNPMPESVTDRPTKAHEYLFLLAKNPTYYFDQEAIREPHQDAAVVNGKYTGGGVSAQGYKPQTQGFNGSGIVMRDREYNPAGRNRRSVWTIPTESYEGAHFATFPRKLVEPCVLAGSKQGDTVLDPFAGSGTTLWVARQHFRRAIGVELSPEYAALAADRLKQSVLPFVEAL